MAIGPRSANETPAGLAVLGYATSAQMATVRKDPARQMRKALAGMLTCLGVGLLSALTH